MRTNPQDQDHMETYPEGGREAWLVGAWSWCAMIPAMGLLNSLAVMQTWPLEHDLEGMSESTVGWILSTYTFFRPSAALRLVRCARSFMVASDFA